MDFIYHYFLGNGRTVTVRETGNLRAIVEAYRSIVIDNPRRLPGQIADVARKNVNQSFSDDFNSSYNMQSIIFSIGDTVIKGEFSGSNEEINGVLNITGSINFQLRDVFRDPLDIGETVSKIVAAIGNGAGSAMELADEVVTRVEVEFGTVHRQLRDFIHNRALNELLRQKNAAYLFDRKSLTEIPGGTPYDIIDDWGANFSAKVIRDKSRSRFKR